MLPTVTNPAPKLAIAALAAFAVTLGAVAPAQALGKNERKFMQGVAAAMIVDRLLDETRKPRYYAPAPQPQYLVRPAAPAYAAPVYQRPSIYQTPAAQAFNAYGPTDRKRIQQRLAAMGYYRSGIDGAFGPGTYNAVTAYARDSGRSNSLSSRDTVFGVYDGLIY